MTPEQPPTAPAGSSEQDHTPPSGGAVVSPRTLARWTAVAVVVVAIAVGMALYFTRDAQPTGHAKEPARTIKGKLQVFGACGTGGYSDLRAGAQVKLTDGSENILDLGELRSTGSCTFAFEFTNPPTDKPMYGLKMGDKRGVFYVDKDEAFGSGFDVSVGN